MEEAVPPITLDFWKRTLKSIWFPAPFLGSPSFRGGEMEPQSHLVPIEPHLLTPQPEALSTASSAHPPRPLVLTDAECGFPSWIDQVQVILLELGGLEAQVKAMRCYRPGVPGNNVIQDLSRKLQAHSGNSSSGYPGAQSRTPATFDRFHSVSRTSNNFTTEIWLYYMLALQSQPRENVPMNKHPSYSQGNKTQQRAVRGSASAVFKFSP